MSDHQQVFRKICGHRIIVGLPVASAERLGAGLKSMSGYIQKGRAAGEVSMTNQDTPDRQRLHQAGLESIDPTRLSLSADTNEVPTNDQLLGLLIGDKYEIQERIGQGGMSIVYRAVDSFTNRVVALKIMIPGRELDTRSVQRFQQEAKATANLDHPNIAAVHDFNLTSAGQPYMVMAFVTGETLAEKIRKDGHISIAETLTICTQICDGMSHAHERGILHRDLKPSNVLLSQGTGAVRIVDFGIAKFLTNDGQPQLTQTGEVMGSPYYMSPEQVQGQLLDQRSDVYSMGCLIFEMLTGAPPFCGQGSIQTLMMHVSDEAPSLREGSLGRDFPVGLEQVVAKALKKDPSARYQTMKELKAGLLGIGSVSRDGQPLLSLASQTKPKSGSRIRTAVVSSVILLTAGAIQSWQFFNTPVKKIDLPTNTTAAVPTNQPSKRPTPAELEDMDVPFRLPAVKTEGLWKACIQRDIGGPLASLSNFNLKGADLIGTLSKMNNLQEVNLAGNQSLSDEQFRGWEKLKLTKLVLNDTGIGDKCLMEVSKIKSLDKLELRGTTVTDKGLMNLKALPALHTLDLRECPYLTKDGLNRLKEKLSSCVVLTDYNSPKPRHSGAGSALGGIY